MKKVPPYHTSLIDFTKDMLMKGIRCRWDVFNEPTTLGVQPLSCFIDSCQSTILFVHKDDKLFNLVH